MQSASSIGSSSFSSSDVEMSGFYLGTLWHKRYQPVRHAFKYPLYMTALDLDDVDRLDKRHWWFSARHWSVLEFRSTDYLRHFKSALEVETGSSHVQKALGSDGSSVKSRAIEAVKVLGGDASGLNKVLMLAQLRCFGIYFSPVNFFFLYDDLECRYLLAEVSNTPWNERHCYLVDMSSMSPNPKVFHVSPFMNMEMEYRWKVTSPSATTKILIENWNEKKLFTALFTAVRRDFSGRNMLMLFAKWPIVTLSIVKSIYWQALRLFLKGVKYVPYSKRRSE